MARINCIGISWEKMADDIKKKGKNGPKVMKKMVHAAGDEFVKQIVWMLAVYGVRDTDVLIKSVGKGPAKHEGDGFSLEAWPQGVRKDDKHKKPARNETIAFVNEHGRKKRRAYPGRPFMKEAAKESQYEAVDAMKKVLERELNGK